MLGDYVHIGQAAKLISVVPQTLIRWEEAGLIKISRDSLGKRIYRKKDLPRMFELCYGRRAPGRYV
jgi:DNA-binding transcriptional MerR regulator